MDDIKFEINVHFGRIECRSWFESAMNKDGALQFVGMGSETEFDEFGMLISHKLYPTGLIAFFE